MKVRLTVDRPSQALSLHLAGEFDLATAPVLAETLNAFDARSFANVRLDLARVTFCDSTALSALIEAHRTVTDAGGVFALSQASRPVRRLLEVSGCDWLLSASGRQTPLIA